MKISAKTDYALRLLFELAINYEKCQKEGCIKLKDVSNKHNIPLKFLQQIVLLLKKQGFIRTTQGLKGGVCLAKHPKDIKIADVIKILEGDFLQIACFNEVFHRNCKELNCVFENLWKEIYKKVEEVIKNTTFEDLISNYQNRYRKIEYYI